MYLTKEDFPVNIETQSTEIPGSGGARQSTLTPVGVPFEYFSDDAKTVVEVIHRGFRISKNGPCLGWRDSDVDYKWLTYGEVIQRSRNISFGLIASGLKRGQETILAIYAPNCVEWILVEHACYYQSCLTVPVYETFGFEALIFILNQVEAEFVLCDAEKKVVFLLDNSTKLPSIKQIIAIQNISEGVKNLAAERGIAIHQLTDIENLGRKRPQSLKLPDPLDLATICYTSGTTGNPKGVIISHRNLVINSCALLKHLGTDFLSAEDRTISYLPLAHIFERNCIIMLLCVGASIGFFRGHVKYLNEDICTLKPTVFVAVPRVLNKIYDEMQSEVNCSKIKKYLLGTAMLAKQAELRRGVIRNNSLWDYLVLQSFRNALGGRIRLIVSGSAPIRDEVVTFFRCCLGCVVLQSYGQTEVVGAITTAVIGDLAPDTVGPPLPCNFVKLIDAPEMNYYSKNGEGEILVKGPGCTKGYFKEPSKTLEILDNEGWIHTGDIGRWLKNGSLSVIGRKKNIFKLSQGEFVSPEKVERIYLASPYVQQIFVHGESLENCLVSIVVPYKEELLSLCSNLGVNGEYEEICQNKVVRTYLLKHLNQLGQEADLKGFEQAKAIYLHPQLFSQENGILTATMKVKRPLCYEKFKDILQNLYKNLSEERKKQLRFAHSH